MINLIQCIGCYGLKIKCYIGYKYTNNGFDIGMLHTALSNFTVIDVAVCHIALFELYVASILLLCSGDIEANPGPVYVVCPNCNTEVHIKKKICQCGHRFKKCVGRPLGTTRCAG